MKLIDRRHVGKDVFHVGRDLLLVDGLEDAFVKYLKGNAPISTPCVYFDR